MSEANKLLLKRWFEEVWNQKSEAAIDEMFSKEGKSQGFPEPESVLVTSSRQAHKHDEREATALRRQPHLTNDRVGDQLLTVTSRRSSVNLDALGAPRCRYEPKESEPAEFGRPAGSRLGAGRLRAAGSGRLRAAGSGGLRAAGSGGLRAAGSDRPRARAGPG